MSKRVAALAAVTAALFVAPVEATVIFNWVQSGTPSPTNVTKPFAIAISDDTYRAGQGGTVSFGAYTGTVGADQTYPDYLHAQVLSPDVSATVLVVRALSPGTTQYLPLSDGLTLCNSPPWQSVSCRLSFASTAVQSNSAFGGFYEWGASNTVWNGGQSSSFKLAGSSLSVNITSGHAEESTFMTTDSTGVGSWGAMSDGHVVPTLNGTGFWQIDASTIPSAVPLPPSAWLMALGLTGVALRTRRR